MRTPICDLLGVEYPIFAFSHCRDVVAAVTKAGGFGVLGASLMSADELSETLTILDKELRGRPYGVDMVISDKTARPSEDEIRSEIPQKHLEFVASLADRFQVPAPLDQPTHGARLSRGPRAGADDQWEVARDHNVKLVVGALGPLPRSVVDEAHDKGMLVGGLVGAVRHAELQVQAGADVIVAQGTEAGGHTGDISTFVLVPQVVDAVGEIPVLAAGGVGDGRQIAAAIALGAQGVWTGSIWLTTTESDLPPVLVDKLLKSDSGGTLRSRALTGRPVRQLRTSWLEAWDAPDSPGPLPPPFQRMLVAEQIQTILDRAIPDPVTYPAGQMIGMLHERRSAADVVRTLVEEYVESAEQLRTFFSSLHAS